MNPAPGELPYHEWLVEFSKKPKNISLFKEALEKTMQQQNIYYKDLIVGGILQTLVLTPLKKNAFINYMKSEGKLGGQNKVPRLSNDRLIADKLS
jgi:hypothetical protein